MPNYEDDFYKKENIIGYTGDPNVQPTVYFREGDRFGRITQAHANPANVGRNLVRDFEDYRIENTGRDGKAQEFYDAGIRHTSRNPFVPVEQGSAIIEELATAINHFPAIKPKFEDA